MHQPKQNGTRDIRGLSLVPYYFVTLPIPCKQRAWRRPLMTDSMPVVPRRNMNSVDAAKYSAVKLAEVVAMGPCRRQHPHRGSSCPSHKSNPSEQISSLRSSKVNRILDGRFLASARRKAALCASRLSS
jgi:hypothetical protein